MGAVGNLDDYMKFKPRVRWGDAANNPGGSAGAASGWARALGLGASMAGMLGQAMQPQQQQAPQPAPPSAPVAAAPAASAQSPARRCRTRSTRWICASKGRDQRGDVHRMMAKWETKLKDMG